MDNIITVLEIIKQIAIAVGIISGSSVLTGLLNAAMNIQGKTVKHIVSWVLPTVFALLLCAFGTISFGYGYWDYLMSAFAGAVVGGYSNPLKVKFTVTYTASPQKVVLPFFAVTCFKNLREVNSLGSVFRLPTIPSGTRKGFNYFDVTLGKQVYWSGSAWVDATGTTV